MTRVLCIQWGGRPTMRTELPPTDEMAWRYIDTLATTPIRHPDPAKDGQPLVPAEAQWWVEMGDVRQDLGATAKAEEKEGLSEGPTTAVEDGTGVRG